MTGTSTACSVFGRNREPGFNAPQPAAHPNLPRKSSFFSGKQIGAKKPIFKIENNILNIILIIFQTTHHIEDLLNNHITDVRHIMNGSFQCQYGHIETIGLWGKFKVGMNVDFTYTKRVSGQRFNGRIDYVVTEGDVNLSWTGTGHTMAGRDDVLAGDQRSAASRKQRPVINLKRKRNGRLVWLMRARLGGRAQRSDEHIRFSVYSNWNDINKKI